MNWLGEVVQNFVAPNDAILSIGCGIYNDIKDIQCKSLTGIDIYEPYVKRLQEQGFHVIHGDITKFQFAEKSYDVVIALDLLEHLEYNDAITLLEKMKNIAKNCVVIYTPVEFHDNANNMYGIEIDPDSPYYQLGINQHQIHKCLIKKEDLINHGYSIIDIRNGGYIAICGVSLK